ncbi:MAG: hypothetical protein ABEJ74_03760 [Haloferacaceae archaeon]
MRDQQDVSAEFAAATVGDLPSDLAADLDRYAESERLDPDAAVRQLLRDALERWRLEEAVARLEDGEVSFDRAVEIADVTPWELADRLEERGVQWVDTDHLSHDLDGR